MKKLVRALVLLLAATLTVSAARLVRPVKGRGITVRARFLRGRLRGAWHWAFGPPPDDASDAVLADRVRSELGPLEKRLDLPHVNVAAVGHVVTLHGVVDTAENAELLVAAVQRDPSVRQVESNLHVGMTDTDTRPSYGRLAAHASPALERLLDAVQRASGNGRAAAYPTLRAVVMTFVECLPNGERSHFMQHLPEDVRVMAAGAGRHRHVDDMGQFGEQVAARGAVRSDRAELVAQSVFAELRSLVPEEVHDVAAVLPASLRDAWRSALPV